MFVMKHRDCFRVEPICSVVEVSASACYQRAKEDRRSACAISDERLLGEIRRIHAEHYDACGSRRSWKEMLRRGERVARCRTNPNPHRVASSCRPLNPHPVPA